MHLTGPFEDRDGCVFFGRGRGAEVLGPVTRAATIHFLSNRYISRYKCHDTIHDTIHHNIQLTSDIMLLNCFEIFNFH